MTSIIVAPLAPPRSSRSSCILWLTLAPPGSPWLPLAPTGCHWLPLAPPGSSLLLLAPPGSSWLLLGSPWLFLAPPGSPWSWLLLGHPWEPTSNNVFEHVAANQQSRLEAGQGWTLKALLTLALD